jgi:hypothetical protein
VIGGAVARPAARFPRSGRDAEALMWRRLWMPLLPACFALAVLLGWAAQEPDETDNALDPVLLVVALPGAIIGARAMARAFTSALCRVKPLAATVGLLRPRVIIDAELVAALETDGLVAVEAHERAHVRHRDPLQIWLAQFATDLQWPAPSAQRRFHAWLHALEVARDEEVREAGISGDTLASAIVTAAQLARATRRGCAALLGYGDLLRDRIARLLRPLVDGRRRASLRWLVAVVVVAVGLELGVLGGDRLLRLIPGVS